MTNPFFSIIIPTYNRMAYLPIAIKSVINQSFDSWELIIIDDGSTDNTAKFVSGLKDSRIIYYYQENRERSAARNKGIELCNGEYICFLDSDDYFKPERLDELRECIISQGKSIALFYTGIEFYNNQKLVLKKLYSENYDDIFERIINEIIGTPQVCIHKEILQKHKFNEKYNLAEDLDLWVRIASQYPFIYLNVSSVVAVEHIERSINQNENHYLKSLNVLKRIFNDTLLKHKINNKTKYNSLSNIYFKIAQYNISNGELLKSIPYSFKSFFYKPLKIRNIYMVRQIFNAIIKKV